MNLIPNINMRLGVGETIQYFATHENIKLLCNKPHSNWLIGLLNFAKFLQDKNINKMVEIGSFQGESSTIFSLYLPNTKIYAVDPLESGYDLDDMAALQDMEKIQHNFTVRTSLFPNITQIKLKSQDAVNNFNDSELDLVYIDGDHRYEPVKQDILLWKRKIKPGGYITGHDYGREPINKALLETIGTPDHIFVDSSWIKKI
jgi:predicted O-methyltransferase YrrM